MRIIISLCLLPGLILIALVLTMLRQRYLLLSRPKPRCQLPKQRHWPEVERYWREQIALDPPPRYDEEYQDFAIRMDSGGEMPPFTGSILQVQGQVIRQEWLAMPPGTIPTSRATEQNLQTI